MALTRNMVILTLLLLMVEELYWCRFTSCINPSLTSKMLFGSEFQVLLRQQPNLYPYHVLLFFRTESSSSQPKDSSNDRTNGKMNMEICLTFFSVEYLSTLITFGLFDVFFNLFETPFSFCLYAFAFQFTLFSWLIMVSQLCLSCFCPVIFVRFLKYVSLLLKLFEVH